MSKKTTYILFFLKFMFSLSLIFWTIKMTMSAGVGTDDDNSFLSEYKIIDDSYNKIALDYKEFLKTYQTNIVINGIKVENISYDDVYLSQRVIKKRKNKKNLLKEGSNTVSLEVINIHTKKIVEEIKSNIVFTMPSSHKFDTKTQINASLKPKSVTIGKISYWNIMGEIEVNKLKYHFYIKTNAM